MTTHADMLSKYNASKVISSVVSRFEPRVGRAWTYHTVLSGTLAVDAAAHPD